jgi:hypothetical protein
MGGKAGPVEENHSLVQQPLSPDDHTVKNTNPKTLLPKIDIHERVRVLEALMSTEDFHARNKGIPYFDPPPKLDPALPDPSEEIICPVVPPFKLARCPSMWPRQEK